jgi:hypothetical protein
VITKARSKIIREANRFVEKATKKVKETLGIDPSEAEGKASQKAEEAKGKTARVTGEAKGKAEEMKGEAKGKAEEVSSKLGS